MQALHLQLPHTGYDICIEPGALARTAQVLKRRRLDGPVTVITSPRIRHLHGKILEQSLYSAGRPQKWLEVTEGEQSKCLAEAECLYTRLIKTQADRRSLILAFGGGMIGDLAGFVAATYLRGIPLVQIPTTLLAQIDSSIGGKVGINHPLGKNLIGAFHQPVLVLTDPLCLQTLPRRELRAGLMEAIKYGVIAEPALFTFLENKVDLLLACDPAAILRVVRNCASIKAGIVTEDERESGLRMILNFGHTLGHALESVTAYRTFKHGEAVGWGMIFASRWAVDLGFLKAHKAERIVRLIRSFGLPNLPELAAAELLSAMGQDKKRVPGALRWILPDKIGHVFPHSTNDLPALQKALVRHGLAF